MPSSTPAAEVIPRGLVARIRDTMQRHSTTRLRRALYYEVVEIIAEEYASELVLEDIARRVASSRRQLQRAFDEVGHTSFRTYLTNYRIDRAAELLVETDLPVRDVADSVGYRQPAQFAKAFRRRHGCAPSEFRALPRERSPAGESPLARAA